ncbi:MAG TPA: hypothetical protein VM370_05715 [Candidatus Thermoplasmatota archaeon]|nr:hypothetical protein [Candidatus Thermoplasmatota archaeon]
MRATVPLLALVVLAFPSGLALPAAGLLGDAGTGLDAGGSGATAMPLAYGSYHGNLTPGDSDWFVFPAASAPSCLSADLVASTAMRAGVGAESGASVLGGLTEGVFSTVLAVEPVPVRLAVLPDEAPWDAVSVGPYAFDVSVAPPTAVGDARFDDAPSSLAAARAAPAACFAGHFDDDGDTDAYSFPATADDVATVSLAVVGQNFSALTVKDAAGATLAGPISSGGSATFTVPADGTYFLVASGVGDRHGDYALGLVVGPPGQGCRPACLETV